MEEGDDDNKKLLLCEMKARVSAITAQEEHNRVTMLHNGEKYVLTSSKDINSWNYIKSPQERLQALHHCYTYGKQEILHVAGDSQGVISGVLFQIDTDLMQSYSLVLDRLYQITLSVFY